MNTINKIKEKLTDVEQRIIDIEIKRLDMTAEFRKTYFSQQLWIHVTLIVAFIAIIVALISLISNKELVKFVATSLIIVLALILIVALSYHRLLTQIEKEIFEFHTNLTILINKIQKAKLLGIQKWNFEPASLWKLKLIIYALLILIIILIFALIRNKVLIGK